MEVTPFVSGLHADVDSANKISVTNGGAFSAIWMPSLFAKPNMLRNSRLHQTLVKVAIDSAFEYVATVATIGVPLWA